MCYAVIGLISAAISAYSAVKSAESTEQANKYNAKVHKQAAEDATMQGNIRAQEIREKARKVAGAQAAAFGAKGLDINTGTPASLINETNLYGELDALRTINNSQRQAWGLNSTAEQELYQGKMAKRAGYMQAGSSLLSSASSMYGSYMNMGSR